MTKYVVAFFGCVSLLLFLTWYSFDAGVRHGIQMYHTACYEVGGLLIDKNLSVVQCQGLTQLPKEEEEMILKDLDKGTKM